MRFSGTVEIEAPRQRVWDFLMDPNQVGSCGPGVQSIEEVDADHFNIRAKVGVGFITATFTIHAEFLERVERERAKIGIRGQAPGSAVDGHGEMLLRDAADGGTVMDWSTEVNIHGTIASVGARLIEGTANKLIGQTFSCIKSKLEVEGLAVAPVAAAAPEVEMAVTAADAGRIPAEPVAPLLEAAMAGGAVEVSRAAAARAAEPSITEPSITEPSITEPSITEPSIAEPGATVPAAPSPETPAAAPAWAAQATPASLGVPLAVSEAGLPVQSAEGEPAAAPGGETAPAAAPTAGRAAETAPAAAPTARLQYLTAALGPTGTNVYLIGNPDTGDALAVDVTHPSLAWVVAQLQARNWRLRHLISTSGDWDHIGDNAALQSWAAAQAGGGEAGAASGEAGGAPGIAVHPSDRERLVDPATPFAPFDVPASSPSLDLLDGTRIRLGAIEFEVLHTPGHTPGSICLLVRGANLLLSGDTLMAGGWGRTDLPGGNAQRMADSLRHLAGLGDEVTVLPGHGPATTIGRERRWIDEVLSGRLLR